MERLIVSGLTIDIWPASYCVFLHILRNCFNFRKSKEGQVFHFDVEVKANRGECKSTSTGSPLI